MIACATSHQVSVRHLKSLSSLIALRHVPATPIKSAVDFCGRACGLAAKAAYAVFFRRRNSRRFFYCTSRPPRSESVAWTWRQRWPTLAASDRTCTQRQLRVDNQKECCLSAVVFLSSLEKPCGCKVSAVERTKESAVRNCLIAHPMRANGKRIKL